MLHIFPIFANVLTREEKKVFMVHVYQSVVMMNISMDAYLSVRDEINILVFL